MQYSHQGMVNIEQMHKDFPLPNQEAFFNKTYAVCVFRGMPWRDAPSQQGHRVTSLPISKLKSSTIDSLAFGALITGVFVSLLQSFSFVDLLTGLSRP